MKILEHQKHGSYKNLRLIALDNLQEANSLVHAFLGDPTKIKKATEEMLSIIRWNKNYQADGWQQQTLPDRLRKALHEIEYGDPAIEHKAAELAHRLVEAAYNVEPSLSRDHNFRPSEEGEVFDAGKLSTGDPLSFFGKAANDRPNIGKGDGAFRILINTDVAWWGDPCTQCAALMALCQLLQREAPVEVWCQQGWLGGSQRDGITLFKVFEGQQLTSRNLFFWIGSSYKDNPYSLVLNKMLGRQNDGTSGPAEIPCDLYIFGPCMPRIEKDDFSEWTQWVAQTSRPLLFDEEMPSGWSGYKTKLEDSND